MQKRWLDSCEIEWIYLLILETQYINTLEKLSDKERRLGQDRRQECIPFYKLIVFKGKRRTLRRVEDRKKITILDQYRPPLLIIILIILSLSLLDAALTLILLERGAVELNPVMHYYITLGHRVFVVVKYGITAVALLIILMIDSVISSKYRFGSLLFPFCLVVFGSVIIWQLYLLTSYSWSDYTQSTPVCKANVYYPSTGLYWGVTWGDLFYFFWSLWAVHQRGPHFQRYKF